MDDAGMIAELRHKFFAKYVDPPCEPYMKFDQRDVRRIENDDLYALSFIHWRKGDVNAAVEMISDVLRWRKENGVPDLSVDVVGQKVIEKGIVYVHGRDNNGMRVLHLIARLQTKHEKEASRRLFMFWLDRIQRNEPGKHIIFIMDTYKTSMIHVDLGLIRFIIDAFSTYFPDMIEKIIIIDLPWIMNAIWNIVKQWMSEEQREKIAFCSRKDLTKYVPVDQLPESMGGKDPWKFSFPPFPDDLNQDFDFTNDPMNFEKIVEEEDKSMTMDSTIDTSAPDCDVTMNEFDNNNHKKEESLNISKQKEESLLNSQRIKESLLLRTPAQSAGPLYNGEDPTPFGTEIPHKSSDMDRAGRLSPLNDHSYLRAEKSNYLEDKRKEPMNDFSVNGFGDQDSSQQKDGVLRRRIFSYQSVDPTFDGPKSPLDMSFKSVKDAATKESDSSLSSSKHDPTLEIKLRNLLVISPVSELVFKVDPSNHSHPDRPHAHVLLRNPNHVTDSSDDMIVVAFKIKTTSPERYHVKPSVGILGPGVSAEIIMYLNTGFDTSAPKDRFLLIYKQFPMDGTLSPTHGDIIKFWKSNTDKSSYSEHKLRVSCAAPVPPYPRAEPRPEMVDSQQTMRSSPVSIQSTPSFATSEKLQSGSTDFRHLLMQVESINKKIMKLECDTRWMRRRMRHTMGLLIFLIFLVCLLLCELFGFATDSDRESYR